MHDLLDQSPDHGAAPADIILDEPAPLPSGRQDMPASVADNQTSIAEQTWERALYALLAAALVIGFFFANACYWVSAHPGVDQNGYLVGGRMLAQNLTMRLTPAQPGSTEFDPHQFVGRMWVGADLGTPAERYYPKYPIGLPALVAASLWIGGDSWGPILAYWINPLAMTLAVGATFLLVREVASSFWAFCAAVVFATSPVTIGLTTNPNSHATAAACATWGIYLLLRWWRKHGIGRALPAGLLLGYACTIRYTEGLLILPLVLVLILSMRWRSKLAWIEAFWALAGWAMPVGGLLWYNWAAMGHLTGYDGTNESLGFSWQYAADNWETVLRQLGTIALYCIFPFSIIGLIAMFRRNWRVATVLAAWALPCLLAYTFYYWAPDTVAVQLQQGNFIGYMRFFLTVLPAMLMAAYWLFDQVCRGLAHAMPAAAWAPRLAQISLGIINLIAVAVHLQTSTFGAETDQNLRLMLQTNTQRVLATAPAGSMLFAQDQGLLHHLQFERDYMLYTGETFNKWFIDRLPQVDNEQPQGWEPLWRESLYARLKDFSQARLDQEQRRLMAAALAAGRRVFFIIPRRDNDPLPGKTPLPADIREFRRVFPGGEQVRRFATPDRFDTRLVAAWSTPIVRPYLPDSNKPRKRAVAMRIDRRQTMWEMVEVTQKSPEAKTPAKAAAARPNSLPATASATARPPATRSAPAVRPATPPASAAAPTSAATR